MARIADGLVVHPPRQPARVSVSVPRPPEVLKASYSTPSSAKVSRPPSAATVVALAVHDGFAGLQYSLIRPLGAPGQVVAQGTLRVARQRPHAHAQTVQLVKAAPGRCRRCQ